jgi:DNA-binding NarL/FixJ family response regulator
VLVDITLAGQIDGIEATAQIKRFAPDVQVVILSGMDLDQYLVAAIEAGASGFITKGADLDHVIGQIRAAARGEMLIDPARLAKLMRSSAAQRGSIRDRDSTLGRLTAREQEVLSLMAEGHRNEQIAVDLTISPHTVQSHVKNILSKLGAHSRLEAVARAAKTGALSPKD